MMQTGDTKPLEYMAGKLGYSLVAARSDAPHVTPGAFHGQSAEMSASNPALDDRLSGEKGRRA